MSSSQTDMNSPTRPGATERPTPRAAQFKLARVERTGAPDGADGDNWYRYVLDNGRSTITGQRRGSLKDVTAHAHRYAEQVNARGLGAQSIWAPRGKK